MENPFKAPKHLARDSLPLIRERYVKRKPEETESNAVHRVSSFPRGKTVVLYSVVEVAGKDRVLPALAMH